MIRYFSILVVFYIQIFANDISYSLISKNETNINVIQSDQKNMNENQYYGFGYSPSKDVLISVSLDENINYITINSPLIETIKIYDQNHNFIYQQGLYSNSKQYFVGTYLIDLSKIQSKDFYIKCSSQYIPLVISYSLFENYIDLAESKYNHGIMLNLFFGFILAILIFNVMVYLKIKDRKYLLYCAYLVFLTLHHFMYTGYFRYFTQDLNIINTILQHAPVFATLAIITYIIFLTNLLDLKENYKKLDKALKLLGFLLVLFSIILIYTDIPIKPFRGITYLSILLVTTFTVFYVTFKDTQYKTTMFPVIIGQLMVLGSMILMTMISSGSLDLGESYSRYTVEYLLMIETVLFSIILSNKIKKLEIQNAQYLQNYEELNHRIVNNLQRIRSIINIFTRKIDNTQIKQMATLELSNRINAFIELYTIIGKNYDSNEFNSQKYINNLIELYIQSYTDSSSDGIEIIRNIKTEINQYEAPYVALIINEAINNCIKHAFNDKINNKTINISLLYTNNQKQLIIEDNGKENIENHTEHFSSSYGLTSLESIVNYQLKGELSFSKTPNGGKLYVTW